MGHIIDAVRYSRRCPKGLRFFLLNASASRPHVDGSPKRQSSNSLKHASNAVSLTYIKDILLSRHIDEI